MDIMKLATQLITSNIEGYKGDDDNLVQSVIGNLLGDSSNEGIDLGGLVSGLQNSGLGDIASSWLGDGANADISASALENLLGSDKIDQAAQQLGANRGSLLEGLQQMIPQVVDNSSKDGSLLDSVGGLSGLAGMASKLLK